MGTTEKRFLESFVKISSLLPLKGRLQKSNICFKNSTKPQNTNLKLEIRDSQNLAKLGAGGYWICL